MKKNKQQKTIKLTKLEKTLISFIISLPLIISIGTIISLIHTDKAPVVGIKGLMLSPVKDPSSLITTLVIFSIIYITFLVIGFYIFIKKLVKRTIAIENKKQKI